MLRRTNQHLDRMSFTTEGGTTFPVNLLEDTEKRFGLRAGSLSASMFWAATMLHELGHIMGGLPNDGGNEELSATNQAKIFNNCFKDLLKK